MNKHIISFVNKKSTAVADRKEMMVESRRNRTADHKDFKVNCSKIISFVNKKSTAVADRKEMMVARDGIEPPTQGFSVPCSTN